MNIKLLDKEQKSIAQLHWWAPKLTLPHGTWELNGLENANHQAPPISHQPAASSHQPPEHKQRLRTANAISLIRLSVQLWFQIYPRVPNAYAIGFNFAIFRFKHFNSIENSDPCVGLCVGMCVHSVLSLL